MAKVIMTLVIEGESGQEVYDTLTQYTAGSISARIVPRIASNPSAGMPGPSANAMGKQIPGTTPTQPAYLPPEAEKAIEALQSRDSILPVVKDAGSTARTAIPHSELIDKEAARKLAIRKMRQETMKRCQAARARNIAERKRLKDEKEAKSQPAPESVARHEEVAPTEEVKEAEEVSPAGVAKSEPPESLSEVAQALSSVYRVHGIAKAKEILSQYGVNGVSQLSIEKHGAFIDTCRGYTQ